MAENEKSMIKIKDVSMINNYVAVEMRLSIDSFRYTIKNSLPGRYPCKYVRSFFCCT